MTAAAVAERAGARRTNTGWIARCPAHEDRSPSLSIHEGRDGRTLLKCYAGCDVAAIARALQLEVSDLFTTPAAAPTYTARTVASRDDVEQYVRQQLERIVAEESQQFGPIAELTRHRNSARTFAERRFGVTLRREAGLWWESEPHCLDPAWSACVEGALSLLAARGQIPLQTLRRAIVDLPKTQLHALHIARWFQLEMTCAGRQAAA